MWRLIPGLVLASGCNQVLGIPDVQRARCEPDDSFTRLTPVGGLDSELGTQGAQLSRDERTIVFSRLTTVGPPSAPVSRHGDLYIAHRDDRDDDFRDAAALDELNTESDERGASLSDDLNTVYFDHRNTAQRYRIFAATRDSPTARFGAPIQLSLGDATRSDLEPFVAPAAIFFSSRGDDGSASLFVAAGRGSSFATPQQLSSLETLPRPSAYESPVVSHDQRTIYFSAPLDNASQPDIWSASRDSPDQPFGAPHAVAELRTISAERPTWISDDNCRLYFTTNRTGQGFQLWMASRAAR